MEITVPTSNQIVNYRNQLQKQLSTATSQQPNIAENLQYTSHTNTLGLQFPNNQTERNLMPKLIQNRTNNNKIIIANMKMIPSKKQNMDVKMNN